MSPPAGVGPEITVERQIRVPLSVDKAFARFTERMGEWSPRAHSLGTAPIDQAVVEPHDDGRWFERTGTLSAFAELTE